MATAWKPLPKSRPQGWLSAANIWTVSVLSITGLLCAWIISLPNPHDGRARSTAQVRTARGELTVAPINERIELAQVGTAAWSHSPTGENDLEFGDHVDPATWKHLLLRSRKLDGSTCEINLLRPDWWLDQVDAKQGGTIDISLRECGIDGEAEVVEIRPCPAVQKCPPGYQTITGTFHHGNARLIDLYVEGLDQPIGTTPNHPFWSVDREDFVVAGALKIGERLSTADGQQPKVLKIVPQDARHDVYNLEVQCTHSFCVTTAGIIVHNSRPCPGEYVRHVIGGPQVKRNVSMLWSSARAGSL